MAILPDTDGFVDAQKRLRQSLGRDVLFIRDALPDYSGLNPGQIDPETGRPYDPTIAPANPGATETVTVKCSVVFQPLSAVRRSQEERDAGGIRTRDNKDLIVDPDDYTKIYNMQRFELDDEEWQIVDIRPDGIGALQRYVVFGESER